MYLVENQTIINYYNILKKEILMIEQSYSYCAKVPQNLPVGIYINMDEIEIPEEPRMGFLNDALEILSIAINKKGQDAINSLQYYAKTSGFELINKQMRNTTDNDSEITQHIKNIFYSMDTNWFYYNVCLFRTESNDYTQNVGGREITSRKLSKDDTWLFPSFISTTITNKPLRPKVQGGKLTIFIFEFNKNEPICGHYLGDTLGLSGESEFLLAPGVAKVKEAYKATIGMGYRIKKAKFVVVDLKFTEANAAWS